MLLEIISYEAQLVNMVQRADGSIVVESDLAAYMEEDESPPKPVAPEENWKQMISHFAWSVQLQAAAAGAANQPAGKGKGKGAQDNQKVETWLPNIEDWIERIPKKGKCMFRYTPHTIDYQFRESMGFKYCNWGWKCVKNIYE